jgi:hypothetical protein
MPGHVPPGDERHLMMHELGHVSLPDLPVDRVYPACMDFDEHLVGSDHGHRCVFIFQYTRISILVHPNGLHGISSNYPV